MKGRVLVSAGEASGDAYGAALVRELRRAGFGGSVEAVGGPRLRAEGARMAADSSRWGAVGIVESLAVAPRVVSGYRCALAVLGAGRPGLFVPIDFGYMNVRLAKRAKQAGWRVLYLVPPGSWRRDRQGADIARVADVVVCPFPWSAELLRAQGADARFYGHPLLDLVPPPSDAPRERRIAVLPGSRAHEVRANLPVAAQAASRLGLPIAVGLAPNVAKQGLEPLAGPGAEFETGAYGVLRRCEAAVVCSGTATLEALLLGCPQVVVYRGDWKSALEYRIRRPKFDYISLPNILAGRPVLAELIDRDATPARVAEELAAVLPGGRRHGELAEAYRTVRGLLGEPGCLAKTASDCLALLRGFEPDKK